MRRRDREVTDKEQIKDILNSCKICHVAMIDEGLPYLVPLSYGYEWKDEMLILFFHSAKEGRKIEVLKKENKVCFEICKEGELSIEDVPCNSGCYFSSVIGNGEVFFIEDGKEKCESLSKLYFHQTGEKVIFCEKQAEQVCVFKIISNDFKAKRRERKV